MKKFFHAVCIALALGTALSFGACAPESVIDPFVPISPGTLPAKQEGKDYSPYAPYEETVTVKVMGTDYSIIGEVPATYNGKKSGPANNAFNDAALKYLNIRLQYVTTTPGEKYEEKLNALIAAGEVPDVFRTSSATTLETLKQAGMLADLGDAFYYLNDELQGMYTDSVYKPYIESCMEDGALYAFPNVQNPYETAQKIYIRKDWLETCGKEIPATYEELVDVARAFRDNAAALAALGGLQAKDIVPIAITKEIATVGNNTAQGFFNIFGTQPDAFFEKDGKLIDCNTSEETKNALAELKKLYDEDLLPKEFYTYTDSKVTNDIVAGKVGIVSGMWHASTYPLQESVSNEQTPSAEWTAIELPSYKGKAVLPVVERVTIQDYNCVSKSCEHPEALSKLCNLFYDMFYSDDAFEKYGTLCRPSGGFFYSWVPAKLWYTPYSIDSYKRVLGVFDELYEEGFRIPEETLTQMASAEFDWNGYYDEMLAGQYGGIFGRLFVRERDNGFKYGYPYMQALRAGRSNKDMTAFEKKGYGIWEQAISPDGGYAYVTELYEGSSEAVFNEFYGIKTPAQQNYGEYLNKTMKTYFLEVISGKKSLNDWEKYVNDYRKNGGDAVLSQVNDWYRAKQDEAK